jgi:serine/threonine-protein kinase
VALTVGARLGPYEVVAPIGAGGMGEVYRARDTRLDRTVAIKILAGNLAADPDLRARFEREARAIAALDHPHICAVHDVGQHDGLSFLVMQHLEGETLAARLARTNSGLPLAQALTIAIEVAHALDCTHRAGITHRDLKPANIMLTKTGARLLDFGLAKLCPAAPVSMSGMTRLATTAPGTASGTILGTVHYMAPEQVEGRDADSRSDIWALGAVLYEMITGRRPFDGDTPASVIGAILRDEPTPPSARQPLTPRTLEHIVERCLVKDPDKRWQNASDLAGELEWSGKGGFAPDVTTLRSQHRWRERVAWMAVTVLAVASLFIVWRRPTLPIGEVVRFSVFPPERIVFSRQPNMTVPTPQFAMSADGRSIVFVAAPAEQKPMLWLRSLADVTARQLAGTEGAQEPFWSPDGRWIAFFAEGRLKKIPSSGGPVQTIAEPVLDSREGAWGPDDTILFGMGTSGIFRVPAAGGIPTQVTTLDSSRQEGSHRWPRFLPGGRHFLFTVRSGLAEHRGVFVGSLDDQAPRLVFRGDTNAQYADDHLLFLDGDTLLGRPFDSERVALGEPFTIAAPIGRSSNGNGAFSVSAAGTIAYAAPMMQRGRLTWYSRNGNALGTVGPDGEYDVSDFRLSPDEARLAISIVDAKLAMPDIWLTDLVRGGTARFTFGPALNASPVWSPDGTRIAFRTNRKGLVEFY